MPIRGPVCLPFDTKTDPWPRSHLVLRCLSSVPQPIRKPQRYHMTGGGKSPGKRPKTGKIEVRKPPDNHTRSRHARHMDMDDDACYRAIETRDYRFDGRLFVAVTTTGSIADLLPSTHAEARKFSFLPTAAAAQAAGFRPCLLCRSETSPDLAV
jgi:Metal binding domain of Ada